MGFLESKEKKVGFYTTIIFHLVVLIIFLLTAIHGVVSEETSFVLDFSKLEELERIEKQEELKAQASKELDDLLSGRADMSQYRNVAVDRSSQPLRDDRSKNPNQVYEEARELQRKLDASRAAALREQGNDEDVNVGNNDNLPNSDAPQYKGPSVVSYSLDGRKAISLPVPAYKCQGGGDVSVQVTVNRKGYVTAASVIENVSSSDQCLIRSAVAAARRSRFRASATSPEKHVGEIVYRFIAQ
ncbi:MAG: hypothetical protein IJ383_09085 [Bacteroidales bacterium]|nr:hypothetical protein [Bacteroidales bacterium]